MSGAQGTVDTIMFSSVEENRRQKRLHREEGKVRESKEDAISVRKRMCM